MPEFFKKLIFELEAFSYVRIDLSLAKHLISPQYHFLIFRLNIVLHDPYQADEIVTEIEEWKQKVSGVCVKSFSRVLLSVLEISCILKKLYYMNLKVDYS